MGLKEIKALRKAEAEKRKEANKIRRELEKKIADLENEISTLDAQKKECETALENTGSHGSGQSFDLNRKLSRLMEQIEIKTSAWEKLTAQLPPQETSTEGFVVGSS